MDDPLQINQCRDVKNTNKVFVHLKDAILIQRVLGPPLPHPVCVMQTLVVINVELQIKDIQF